MGTQGKHGSCRAPLFDPIHGIQVDECELTWRSLLLDLGNVTLVNIKIESIELNDVLCLVREVGYDPNGIKMPVRLWILEV